METVYEVGDGYEDRYGIFSTRELAEAYIQRCKDLKYPWWNSLEIREWTLDNGVDLCGAEPLDIAPSGPLTRIPGATDLVTFTGPYVCGVEEEVCVIDPRKGPLIVHAESTAPSVRLCLRYDDQMVYVTYARTTEHDAEARPIYR